MKKFQRTKIRFRWVMMLVVLTLCALPLLSRASNQNASCAITNNSSLEIHHLYLQPTGQDTWGADLLNDSVIGPAGTFSVPLDCGGAGEVKIIAEDKDGCFLYQVVSCSSDSTWTIPSGATADCGN
ncbi:MAG TPA: hypothetical protein VI306_10645 [Pyrinomonadaceae bacterium]